MPHPHYYPGAEIDVKDVEISMEKHFRHGISPSAAIFLAIALLFITLTFLIFPALQIMIQYYLSPQQASPILKAILPNPEQGHIYPKFYDIIKRLTIILPISAFFFALIGLIFHIRTKGIDIGKSRHNRKRHKKK